MGNDRSLSEEHILEFQVTRQDLETERGFQILPDSIGFLFFLFRPVQHLAGLATRPDLTTVWCAGSLCPLRHLNDRARIHQGAGRPHCLTSPLIMMISPHLIISPQHLTSPHYLTAPHLITSPHLTSSPHLASHHLTSLSHLITSPHLTSSPHHRTSPHPT